MNIIQLQYILIPGTCIHLRIPLIEICRYTVVIWRFSKIKAAQSQFYSEEDFDYACYIHVIQ